MSEKDYDARMHTVEHLLNGAVARKFNIPRAYTTHIEKRKSKIDFHFIRNLDPSEIKEIEDDVNQAIASGVTVWDEFLNYEEASNKYDLSRIPGESKSDNIRIVHVGDADSCPCIGPHLNNTDLVGGVLKIISSDYKEENQTLRIRFKISNN